MTHPRNRSTFFAMVALAIAASAASLVAHPIPAALFGDHAVLQRDCPVAVWGTADPSEAVKVRFGGVSAEGVADANGLWKVVLPCLTGGEKGTLFFESPKGSAASEDVLVGDVWLCAGQSNMEWTLRKSDHAAEETAAADFPEIRQFKVPPLAKPDLQDQVQGKWSVCTPQTAGDFTAIGYYLAKDLHERSLVPQGLLNCSRGGTQIESWLSPEALASQASLSIVMDRWNQLATAYPEAKAEFDVAMDAWNREKAEVEKAGTSFAKPKPVPPGGDPASRGLPSSVHNAMAAPVLPYTKRAVIWYQGEANWQHPPEYKDLLQALIVDWRKKMGQGDLPFAIIQLPSYGTDDTLSWPILREGQAAALQLPATSLVVAMGLGGTDIHPLNKQDYAARLAPVVRRDVLGEQIVASGPQITSAVTEGSRMRVLLAGDGTPVLKESPDRVGAFELAGEDRRFYPAKADMDGGDILVTSDKVPSPVALRYAWRSNPIPVLFNKEGFPAAPFRTDQWIDKK